MNSTAKELSQWIIALQNNELLNNKTTLSEMWTPALLNNGETGGFSNLLNGYAMGWPVVSRSEHPAIVSIGGGRSGLFIYPKDNMAIIILTNLQGSLPESFIDEIAGFYIPEMKEANGFGLSPSVKLLRVELEKRGYKYAIEQTNQLKIKNTEFKLREDEVNSWGYKLMRKNRKADAVEIFKLNTILYPNSANTFDSLGEGYAETGETKLAIQNYEKVLKLDPNNTNATEQLKKLKSTQ
jgi:tetratricopeptide (TPR) repeat protein